MYNVSLTLSQSKNTSVFKSVYCIVLGRSHGYFKR